MGGPEVEDTIEAARSWLAYPGASAIEPGEETATRFAKTVIKLADACVVGVSCDRHGGAVHGREAEELRKGIEQCLRNTVDVRSDDAAVVLAGFRKSLYFLLDHVDARDSLAFLEATAHATTCALKGCLHHAHPDCPCDHLAGTEGPCAGCNCCDPGGE
jgi:hypothetical protein